MTQLGPRAGEDDRLWLELERPPQALRARIEEAVRRCPKQALSIVETG